MNTAWENWEWRRREKAYVLVPFLRRASSLTASDAARPSPTNTSPLLIRRSRARDPTMWPDWPSSNAQRRRKPRARTAGRRRKEGSWACSPAVASRVRLSSDTYKVGADHPVQA